MRPAVVRRSVRLFSADFVVNSAVSAPLFCVYLCPAVKVPRHSGVMAAYSAVRSAYCRRCSVVTVVFCVVLCWLSRRPPVCTLCPSDGCTVGGGNEALIDSHSRHSHCAGTSHCLLL